MNKFKVGDRVWCCGVKVEIEFYNECRGEFRLRDDIGYVWWGNNSELKPIVKIKNGVVYE